MLISKIWILFMMFAIMYAISALSNTILLKNKHTIKLSGEIIDNRIQSSGMGMSTYAPIYKYEIDGNEIKCVGSAAQMAPYTIGTTVTLFYNTKKKKLIEPIMNTSNWILAVIFAGIALVTMSFSK